jgi:RNA 2',3'-cyclic 3'-phosphodiesterase
VRLFVALDLPDAVREALRELIARLKAEYRNAKWVRPEAMHVTLKFIGEVDAGKLEPICAALAEVHSAQPMDINFRGLGFFPNERRPRVLWCGVNAPANLAELAMGVERALAPLGIAAEQREFVAHLTLARFRAEGNSHCDLEKLVRAAGELKSYDFGDARETEFHLIESLPKPTGALYKRQRTFSIVKGPA